MRIMVLEPNSMVLEALRDLLESEPDFQVVAERDIVAANARMRQVATDVVVVDDRIAGALSDATRAALAELAERALVVVIGVRDPFSYEDAHVAAGAVGYWPKDGDVEGLIALVRAAGLVAQADRACIAERRRRIGESRRHRLASPATRRFGAAPGARSLR